MMNIRTLLDADILLAVCSWLFPVTYAVHIAEEYWGGGGYSAYILRTQNKHFSIRRFLFLTSLGGGLIVLGIVLARTFGFTRTLLVILSTIVLVNGLSHTITALRTKRYNPGLWSAAAIWIPLGVLTLVSSGAALTWRRVGVAVAIGLTINAIVSTLAATGRKSGDVEV